MIWGTPAELSSIKQSHGKLTPYRHWFHCYVVYSYQILSLSPGSSFLWHKCFLKWCLRAWRWPCNSGYLQQSSDCALFPLGHCGEQNLGGGHRMLGLWTRCVPKLWRFARPEPGLNLRGAPAPARWFGFATSWGPCQPKISYDAIIGYNDGLKKKKSYKISDIIAKGKWTRSKFKQPKILMTLTAPTYL